MGSDYVLMRCIWEPYSINKSMIMEKNAKFFRNAAWLQLSGNWTQVVLFTLVYVLIACVINAVSMASGVASLLLSIFVAFHLQYGYDVSILGFERTGEKVKVEGLFDGFRDYGRVLATSLLMALYIFLWTLLLIVPGIIKGFSYSQIYYIMRDNPEMKNNAAIERSMAMMDGHKWELFCLMLSFIGWILLGIITLGIAMFWVVPYMSMTMANFYEYVKDDYESRIGA